MLSSIRTNAHLILVLLFHMSLNVRFSSPLPETIYAFSDLERMNNLPNQAQRCIGGIGSKGNCRDCGTFL